MVAAAPLEVAEDRGEYETEVKNLAFHGRTLAG
jgi:hypothetical protein